MKKLISLLQSITNTKETPKVSFDPTQFNDPIAMNTSWTPLERGGSNSRTRRLQQSIPSRIEFVPTKTVICFYLGFLLLGVAGILISIEIKDIVIFFFSLFFVFFGILIYYEMTKSIVFDLQTGFWKGRAKPENLHNGSIKTLIRFHQIHALQLISELVVSGGKSRSRFLSYELNLVLQDGKRINVVDHGDIASLREEAKILSKFLSVPIWDAA
jgi:hypothetical protein